MEKKNLNFAFFGTSEFAVKILDKLVNNGYIPSLVVTAPDKPKGRKLILTPPPVKERIMSAGADESGIKNKIKIIQPERLSPDLVISYKLQVTSYDLFVVVAYGKIIPKSILEIPKHGTLNVHPSLLPKFRGPSPIQSFILSGEQKTGVTIMLMDEQVDHGPILASQELEARSTKHEILDKSEIKNQKKTKLNSTQLEEKLAELGGEMLVEMIPKWISGEIKPQEQDHSQATFTKKITKEDGLVDLENDPPEIIYRKFLAFQPWPGIYYFTEKKGKPIPSEASANQGIRVIITELDLEDNHLIIKKVKPEGRNEMSYEELTKALS
ncbi:methionyl-tRNA formyltransferase [Candidatus Parcubacteria bacterium]|nr:MAG: methionyl-tRNA formyltransferase [Candidatus Parcubacteria bacterium]